MATQKVEVIAFLGSGKVGKTSLIRQFLQHNFVEKYTPTVEDTFTKVIEINGQSHNVQFIDSSGSYAFPAMRRLWLQKATAFVLVFSVTEKETFEVLDGILTEIREVKGGDFHKTIPIVIVGNKNDVDKKDFEDEIVEDWVLNNDIPFDSLIFCSAKTNDSVNSVFNSLWEQRRDQLKSNQILEDLQNSCHRINDSQFSTKTILANSKSKRRFSAFAVLTGSNLNPSLNQRRDSATATDVINNLNGTQSPSIRGRRGSRASITKLLSGQKLSSQKQNENLKFDCNLS